METFIWEGKDKDGKKISGEMEALNQQAVFRSLRAKQIQPNMRKIRVKGQGLDKEIKIPGLGPKVSQRDIVIFTRQFATMIDAGLPIVSCLKILSENSPNRAVKKVLGEVKDDVEVGNTLAEALEKHPKNFDKLFTNMIAAGETGGILDIILARLATYYEKMHKLKKQVQTALIYPAVVVAAAVGVTTILLIWVIPTFAELFNGFGAELPALTMLVIALSDFLRGYFIYIFMGLMGTFYAIRSFSKTDNGKKILHPLFLKMPVFGEIIRKVAVARFSRTMGTMMSSGVPILEALTICGRSSGNKVVEREITRVRQSISEGNRMADPLDSSVIFPPMVVQMIKVGETTGQLDAMLGKVADFYDDEVENAVTALKQLIEPIMILVLGVIVGGLVVAMYLPIFKLGEVL